MRSPIWFGYGCIATAATAGLLTVPSRWAVFPAIGAALFWWAWWKDMR